MLLTDASNHQEPAKLATALRAIGIEVPADLAEVLDRMTWTVDIPPPPDLAAITEAKTEKDYQKAFTAYVKATIEHEASKVTREAIAPVRSSQTKNALDRAKKIVVPEIIERFDAIAAEFTDLAVSLPPMDLASMTTAQAEAFIRARDVADRLRTVHAVYSQVTGVTKGDTWWHAMAEFQDVDQLKTADFASQQPGRPMAPLDPYYSIVHAGGRLRLLTKAKAEQVKADFNRDRPAESEPHPHMAPLSAGVSDFLHSQVRG